MYVLQELSPSLSKALSWNG